MKKLMCAIAAVTAGLCYGSVESANVVGYQNKDVLGNSLFSFVAPTFQKVDGSKMMLSDLKLKYIALDQTSQRLWTLTQGGATKQAYYYLSPEIVEDWGEDPSMVGWYTDPDCENPAGEVEMPYGQGFAIVAADSTTTVEFSGSVQKTEATVDIAGGSIFNFTGNVIPADYKLNDIAFIYTALDQTSQRLWTLTQGGATKQDYYYLNAAVVEDWGEDPSMVGWYTDPDCENPAENIDLLAGSGFAVVSADPIQLWVPSPLK